MFCFGRDRLNGKIYLFIDEKLETREEISYKCIAKIDLVL